MLHKGQAYTTLPWALPTIEAAGCCCIIDWEFTIGIVSVGHIHHCAFSECVQMKYRNITLRVVAVQIKLCCTKSSHPSLMLWYNVSSQTVAIMILAYMFCAINAFYDSFTYHDYLWSMYLSIHHIHNLASKSEIDVITLTDCYLTTWPRMDDQTCQWIHTTCQICIYVYIMHINSISL